MSETKHETDAAQINYISLNEEAANAALPPASPRAPAETSPLQKNPQAAVTPKPIEHGLRRVVISAIIFAACITVALILQIYLGPPQVKPHGAIAVDAEGPCALVGVATMKAGGTAVDAAVTSVLCAGVVSMHKTGIGGGGFMLVHTMRSHVSVVFDFRESAPSAFNLATRNSTPSGMTVGVPGFVKGLYAAHQKFGRLPWAQLFEPAIKLAEDGFQVTDSLVKAFKDDPALVSLFFPGATAVNTSQMIKLPKLAAALRSIASQGPDGFYKGAVAAGIVSAAGAQGGVIKKEDLENYNVSIKEPMKIAYKGYQVLTVPPPGNGPTLAMMLNIMNGAPAALGQGMFYHTMAEAMKYGYGVQMSLGDPMVHPEVANATLDSMDPVVGHAKYDAIAKNNHTMALTEYTKLMLKYDAGTAGTSHISVIDPDDMIVSLTTSLNRPFGSKLMTESGFFLNDAINDFTWSEVDGDTQTPPLSKTNLPVAGSRPLSPMAPAIFFDEARVCGTRGAVGGSKGSRIASGVMQTLMNLLQLGTPVQQAIELPRIYSGLYPAVNVEVEKALGQELADFLTKLGHAVVFPSGSLNLIQGVTKDHFDLAAYSDSRGNGTTAKF